MNENLYFYLNGLVERYKNALRTKTAVDHQFYLDDLTEFLGRNDDLSDENKELLKKRYTLELSIVEDEHDLTKRAASLEDWAKKLRFDELSRQYRELALTFDERLADEMRLCTKNILISLDYELQALKLSTDRSDKMVESIARQFILLSEKFESFGRHDYLKAIHCLQHAIEAYELLRSIRVLAFDKAECDLELFRQYRVLTLLFREAAQLFPHKADRYRNAAAESYRQAYQFQVRVLQTRHIHIPLIDRLIDNEDEIAAFVNEERNIEPLTTICEFLERSSDKPFTGKSFEKFVFALMKYSLKANLARDNRDSYVSPGVCRAALVLDIEGQYAPATSDSQIRLQKVASTIARREWLEFIELLNLARNPDDLDSKKVAREATYASRLMELFDAFRQGIFYALNQTSIDIPFAEPVVEINPEALTDTQQGMLTVISAVINALYTGKVQLLQEDSTYYDAVAQCHQSFNRWFNGLRFWQSIHSMHSALSYIIMSPSSLFLQHESNLHFNVFRLMNNELLLEWADNFSKINPEIFLEQSKFTNYARKAGLTPLQMEQMCHMADQIVAALVKELSGRGIRFTGEIAHRKLVDIYHRTFKGRVGAGIPVHAEFGTLIQTA